MEEWKGVLRRRMQELAQSPQNAECIDCSSPEVSWGSTNLGVLFCTECAGSHRSLGVNISRVRSLGLDSWDADNVKSFEITDRSGGNVRANEYWEYHLLPWEKPMADDSRILRQAFIHAKYAEQKWVRRGNEPKRSLADVQVDSLQKKAFITKQGGGRKNWQKRWAVLSNSTLMYFKEPMDSFPKGTISINSLTSSVMILPEEETKRKFAFSLCTPQRNFVIAVDTSEELISWVTALRAWIFVAHCNPSLFSFFKHSSRASALPGVAAPGGLLSASSFEPSSSASLSSTRPSSSSSPSASSDISSVLSFAALEQVPPIFSERKGFLTKQGGAWKSWKKRYFVLKQDAIRYYKSDSDVKEDDPLVNCQGSISLREAQIQPLSIETKKQHCFSVITPLRSFYLQSDKQDEMVQWMLAIQGNIAAHKSKVTRGASGTIFAMRAPPLEMIVPSSRSNSSSSSCCDFEMMHENLRKQLTSVIPDELGLPMLTPKKAKKKPADGAFSSSSS